MSDYYKELYDKSRIESEAYKEYASKLDKECCAYRNMLHRLIDKPNTLLIYRGNNSRWVTQESTIRHAYPSMTPEHLIKEKLGDFNYCWEFFGDFAVVERKSCNNE